MIKKIFLLVPVLISCLVMSAQENFKSLQLNSSPAYVVLGVDPENIQRPNSPGDFVANAQSAKWTFGRVDNRD